MSNRKPIAPTIVLALLPILPALGAQVLAWTGTLPDGAEVQVDPETHKATRIEGGTAHPLWDGVHRMDDGAVVIVRDGIAVPNEEILQSGEGQPAEQETLVGRPCEILAERVCGPEGRCASAPACPPARQLRIQESREHAAAMDRGRSTPSGDQCLEALGNDFFAPCR